MRIGEALGLRREDMHLLASSMDLGCQVAGPHVHVRRRRNPNGALAKARFPRTIPATTAVIDTYVDYQHERRLVAQAAENDVVFVNLFRSPLGRAMTYPNVKSLFNRLSRWAGFEVTPQMLRHAAATLWIRSGVDWDVVQALLGHVSPQSMAPYLHASDADMRAAVERAEAFRVSAARS